MKGMIITIGALYSLEMELLGFPQNMIYILEKRLSMIDKDFDHWT